MTRCMIVDDNRALAEDLGEILHDAGFEVSVFSDPLEVASRAVSLSFEVAVLDLRMPGMDGVELFRTLAPSHPHARFVLMSAYAEDHRIEQALAEGVWKVLCKPFVVADFMRAVEATEL